MAFCREVMCGHCIKHFAVRLRCDSNRDLYVSNGASSEWLLIKTLAICNVWVLQSRAVSSVESVGNTFSGYRGAVHGRRPNAQRLTRKTRFRKIIG